MYTSPPTARPGRLSAALVSALLVLTAGTACKQPGNAADNVAPAAVAPLILATEDVATVARGTIETGPRVSGTLEARVRAVVRAEVGGAVVAVGPEIGQVVKKGDLLVRIESKALGDTVTSARSGVTSAEAQLALAQREVERTRALVEGGAVAARELERARSAEVSARAAVSQARAQLSGSQSQLGDATMRSPIAGVVAQRMINVGDIVGGGATLYEVIDPSTMRLSGQVASDDLASLAIGSSVRFEVRGYKEQRFEGTIARISPAADPATRQIPVIVEIPNPGGKLVAGLYAEGRVAAEARDALIVPLGAIDTTRDQPTVLRAKAGLLERVTVAIGLRDERAEVAEITSGLAPGDVVVMTRAATNLRAGQKVELGTRAAAAGSGAESAASAGAPASAGAAAPAPGSSVGSAGKAVER